MNPKKINEQVLLARVRRSVSMVLGRQMRVKHNLSCLWSGFVPIFGYNRIINGQQFLIYTKFSHSYPVKASKCLRNGHFFTQISSLVTSFVELYPISLLYSILYPTYLCDKWQKPPHQRSEMLPKTEAFWAIFLIWNLSLQTDPKWHIRAV